MNIALETDGSVSRAHLRVFVYGTLQRGQSNHARCCEGVVSVEDAWTVGRLFDLPWGFPALQVADAWVLARGTRDGVADWQTQCRTEATDVGNAPVAQRVYGQLLSFNDPEPVLRRLDYLEGFRPDSDSLYGRVLVPICTCGGTRSAWVYIMPQLPPGARHLPAGRWPERGRSPS